MPKKKRADQLLVEQGIATTLLEAKTLIMTGKIVSEDQKITSPSQLLSQESKLRWKNSDRPVHMVGRGALKLRGAIEDLGLLESFHHAVVLDIGSSTGGFVQCVLELGAELVLALDVGTNQLDWKLRTHPQVLSLEQTHIKHFDPQQYPSIRWILADISFNSLAHLAPYIYGASKDKTAKFLLLVKPQFELSRDEIAKGGVVESQALQEKALNKVIAAFTELGGLDFKTVPSQVKGQKGNQEIFLHFSCA